MKTKKKVAKLVLVSFMARVVVDEDATDSEIIAASKPHFQEKLDNDEIGDNLEEITDDTDCPFGTIPQDKV